MSEVIGIKGRLRQINTHVDKPTPDQPETGRVRMNAKREEEIRAGKSNIGEGDILIFDFEGDPSKISEADNDRTDNVTVEAKTVRGGGPVKPGRETITSYSVGKEHDEITEKDGDAPFDGTRAAKDEKTHLNLFHAQCLGGGGMKVSFRQVRVTDDGTFVSEWIGADDGEGFRVGRQ